MWQKLKNVAKSDKSGINWKDKSKGALLAKVIGNGEVELIMFYMEV
jgi:hypothetical protein